MQHSLHSVDNEGRALARIGSEAKRLVFAGEILGLLAHDLFAQPLQEAMGHANQREAGAVRKGMMMRGARLDERPGFRLPGLAKRCERYGQNAHGGAVAGVAFRERAFDGSVLDIASDAAPAGVADIGRPGLQPRREFLTDVACVQAALADDGAAQRERHLGVVGHLPRLELQPAAADDVAMHAILRRDFAPGHELDGSAERVSDGETKIGRERTVLHTWRDHAMASLNIVHAHPEFAADRQILTFALQRMR